MSTLVTFIERAADLLSGIDGLHRKPLLAGSWMATDGTGLKVLVPQLPAAHNGYVELYRNHQLAVFQYEADKRSDTVAAKLQPFRGTLTEGAEHRFNAVYESGRILEAPMQRARATQVPRRRGHPAPARARRRRLPRRHLRRGRQRPAPWPHRRGSS